MGNIKIPRINRAQISGRITKDPELKRTPSGTEVVRFTVAVDRGYKDKSGSWQSETIFIPVQAWASLAERFCKDAKKGSPVIVDGRISISKWAGKDGNQKETTEIVADQIHVLEWEESNPASTGSDWSQGDSKEMPF